MKNLSLKIDTSKLKLEEQDKKLSPIEMSTKVIMNVLIQYSQQNRGLLKDERNQIYKLDSIFEEAVKNKTEIIELDDKDIGFIRKCFKDTRLTPNDLLHLVEVNIDNIKDR